MKKAREALRRVHRLVRAYLFMSVPGPSLPTGEQKLLVRSENICAPRRRRSAAAGRRNWSRATEEGLMNNHHQPPTGALRVAAHAI